MKSEKKVGSEREGEQTVFDVARIRQLIELMNEHELNEIDLRNEDRRIRLRRGSATVANYVGVPAMAPAPAPIQTVGDSPKPVPVADDKSIFIKSPMVGTFYSKPKPTAASYVKVGDVVQPETIVCLIEAMKTFNELPAGVAGKVVAMMVKEEESVDVNKPLFKLAPL